MGKYNKHGKDWILPLDNEIEKFVRQMIQDLEIKRNLEFDISQEKMADFLGISLSTYGRLSKPKSKRMPSSRTLIRIMLFMKSESFTSDFTNFLQKTEGKKNDKC